MQAWPAQSFLSAVAQVQTFRYASWFSYLDIVPNRYASVTHLDQGLWKEFCSFPPLAFSPQKTFGSLPCSSRKRLKRCMDKWMACHF